MRSTTPPPSNKTGGSFLERRTANSHHVGRYVAGRKEGLGFVHTFCPSLSLVVGTFTSSQPTGLGSIIIPGPQATRYVGALAAGKPHGMGILVTSNGIYRGYFAQGAKQGYGIEVDWVTGEERRGCFSNGRLSGVALINKNDTQLNNELRPSRNEWLAGRSFARSGTGLRNSTAKVSFQKQTNQESMIGQYGAHFVGHTQEGVPHGCGIEQTHDRDCYYGFYSWGRRHGVGKLIRGSNNHTKEYLGDWKDGSRTGFGFETDKTSTYFGTFSQGRREGIGEWIYDDGSEYIGQIIGGQKHGFGRLKTPQGEFYIGNWRHDRQDGIGFYTQLNPSVKYFGVWRGGDFLQEKGVDLSSLNHEPRDLEITRANDEDSIFNLNSNFFDEATAKIIEMDQKLTASKTRIKKEYISVILDYSKDVVTIDKAAKDIDNLARGALKEFGFLWAALARAANNAGFDVDSANRLIEDMEGRGFNQLSWVAEPTIAIKLRHQNEFGNTLNFSELGNTDIKKNANFGLKPPPYAAPNRHSSPNNDPLKDIFSIEKDGTSMTDSEKNTLGKMGGGLLKTKNGVSPFMARGPMYDQVSQIDTPRSNNSQDNVELPQFRRRPSSRSQIAVPALKEEPVRNMTPRASQFHPFSTPRVQKRQYKIDPMALRSSGQENKDDNKQDIGRSDLAGTQNPCESTKTNIPQGNIAISMMPHDEDSALEIPKMSFGNTTRQSVQQDIMGKENSGPLVNSAAQSRVEDILKEAEKSKFLYSDMQNTVSDLKNRLQLETLKCEKLKKKVAPDDLKARSAVASEVLETDKQTVAALQNKKQEVEQRLEKVNQLFQEDIGKA